MGRMPSKNGGVGTSARFRQIPFLKKSPKTEKYFGKALDLMEKLC
jgi:hypothetical protein